MTSIGSKNGHEVPFRRHCEKETSEPVSGIVSGTVPSWLQGELTRIGAGIQKIGNYQYNHIVDGLAVIHKFTIDGGTVTYRSRVLQSDTYKRNMLANRIVVSEFGTRAIPDPCQTIFGRLQSEFKSLFTALNKADSEDKATDNCSVNVGYYGDQLYAMTESAFLRRIDPTTLKTLGNKTNLSDYIAVNSATAHPHVLQDGTVINVGSIYRHKKGPHYGFVRVPPSYNSEESVFANAQLIAEIPSRWKLTPAYFHSFGMTDTGKIIFVESPCCVNMIQVMLGPMLGIGINNHKTINDCITWSPTEKTRFYVVSLQNGQVLPVCYETTELFTFHHVNAFEQDEELIVDLIGYNYADWAGKISSPETIKGKKSLKGPTARRYILPLKFSNLGESSDRATPETAEKHGSQRRQIVDVTPQYLCSDAIELPRINYKFNGKKYQYFYGLVQKHGQSTFIDTQMYLISKVNVVTGESIEWPADDNCRVSEPVFVLDPTKENAAEDDGVILTTLLQNDSPKSVALLILNAKDMTEMGRVQFCALGTVTDTFHGLWAQTGRKVHTY